MRGKPLIFDQPARGGVNLQGAPYLLKDYEARDARNVIASSRGAIRKRAGSVTFATPGVALSSLFASHAPNYLIAAGGTLIYSIDAAGVVTSIATGMTSGLRWEWINAPAQGGQGPVWGMNGTDTPRQWTGAGNTAVWTATTGTLPNGKFLVYLQNRLWVAGMSAYGALPDAPSAVVFSNIGNPRDWPASKVVQFDPNDGEAITGLGTSGPYLLVFKPDKAWAVYDLDTGANRPLGDGVGCVAHRSIVETPDGTFFLSRDQGVCVTNGSTIKRISDRVLPLIATLSQAQRAAATAIYLNGHYYLSFSIGGVANDLTLDYDTKLDAWWIHTIGLQDLAVWEPSATSELYGAIGGVAKVSKLFVDGQLADSGVAYASYWNGPFHTGGRPEIRKRVREIRFDAKGRVQLSITKDFAAGATQATDDNFGAVISQGRALNPGVARAWSVMFGNSTAEDFEIESYVLALTERQN